MWPEIFEFLRIMTAVVLCSGAVKLVDDYLDKEFDHCVGRKNWADYWGQGSLIYAMLFLVIAAGIHAAVSMSLFLASYIVGMFNDLKSVFPSRLKGWQESFFVMAVGILCFGWNLMFFAVFFIWGVQLFDDCLDVRTDCLAGQRNFACRFGTLECFLLGVMAFIFAGWINETVFWPVFSGTAFFYAVLLKFQGARV